MQIIKGSYTFITMGTEPKGQEIRLIWTSMDSQVKPVLSGFKLFTCAKQTTTTVATTTKTTTPTPTTPTTIYIVEGCPAGLQPMPYPMNSNTLTVWYLIVMKGGCICGCDLTGLVKGDLINLFNFSHFNT
jgi:hypothetical protein